MAKAKNKLFLVLTLVALIALGTVLLASCDQTADSYTVTFMVRENGTGEYQQYGNPVQSDKEGKVTLPSQPEVDGYVFRNWYTDENCTSGNEFDGTGVKSNMTVYALMVEQEVTLSLTDGEGNSSNLESTSLANLSEVTAEQESAAQAVNLTFDGWYTDSNFTQKYSDGMDATALYGRYMAKVTYDNGYEELYTELVTPGGKTTAPDARVDDFVKRYMDDEDISYNDSEGNAIDFKANTFDENEVVTVLWKTPGLVYEAIEGNNYRVSGIDTTDITYPAVSVLSKNVTIEGKQGCNVVAVDAAVGLDRYDQAEVFIFNEGIESIRGFYATSLAGRSAMKEVQLPSTLKVLEDSFNMLSNNLSELGLPEGLEVIIDCFWSDMLAAIGTYRENGLDITVTIPSTVTNMVAVPKNLDLSKNGNFEHDADGRLYYVDDNSKILCSEYQSNVTDDGRLVVEEGVTGVQVYLLSTLNYDYLDLPSTFCEVGYNNAAENYPAYTGNLLTPQVMINDPEAAPVEGASRYSYAIVSNLDEITYVTIDAVAMPAAVSDYAFVSTSGVPHNGDDFKDNVKVVLIGDVTPGEAVEIRLTVSHSRNNKVDTKVLPNYKSGDTLTFAAILKAAGVSEEDYNVIVRNVGEVYEGGTITSNMYITVECYAKAGGFTYTVNADGKTATVTGFDSATAEPLTDGTYHVTIDMIDGYIVTAIEDGAFKDVGSVSEVDISNAVTTIGAKAFMNMGNLRLVNIAPGGLSVIGESAFENIGCIYNESTGEWEVNETLPEKRVANQNIHCATIKIPLGNLESVGAYAFKSRAIATFTPVEGEESRYICNGLAGAMSGNYMASKLDEGGFYWYMNNGANSYMGILQYVKQGTETASDGSDVTVIDARLIAIAGGDPSTGYRLNMGISLRAVEIFTSRLPILKTAVVRFEVMTGSVYFIDYPIEFGVVSKVHENAFTDMDDDTRIYWYGPDGDTWLAQSDLQNQSSEIFEDGWWNGTPNSENTVTSDAEMENNPYLGQ